MGGAFIDASDILNTGATTSPFTADGDGGGIYARTADSAGVLYAAGTFINEGGVPAADYVASYDGTWHALGSGTDPGGGAVTGTSRALGSDGTNVYLGTDAEDVAEEGALKPGRGP